MSMSVNQIMNKHPPGTSPEHGEQMKVFINAGEPWNKAHKLAVEAGYPVAGLGSHCAVHGTATEECCMKCKSCDGCTCQNNALRGTGLGITGRQAAGSIGLAAVAGTLLARYGYGEKWMDSIDSAGVVVGLGSTFAGIFAVNKGMRRDDTRILAGGAALLGVGTFFLMSNPKV